jgi:hypothetical protein
MFHTAAFIENVDPAGAFIALNAAAEQVIRTGGDDIFVPEKLPLVIAAAGGVESNAESFMRLVAPSLRGRSAFQIEPLNLTAAAGVEPGSPHRIMDLRRFPLKLVAQEQLNAEINSNPAAAQDQWCVVWFADAVPAQAEGDIFTVRATGAQALTDIAWTNVALTMVEDLPRGRYAVVGARFRSDACVAGRVVFVGGTYRPGALGVDAQDDLEHPMFRHGGLGVWGEFEDLDQPTCDFLAVAADAAEDVYLDLIQVRAGNQ